MKKFTKIIALVLVSAMLALLFVGCGKGGDGSIVGKWEYLEEGVSMIFNFKANGDFEMSVEGEGIGEMTLGKGTYTVNGDKLAMTLEGDEEAEVQNATFSVSGNKLTIDDGEEALTLTRK